MGPDTTASRLAAAPPPGLAASAEQTIGDSGELWAGWDLSEEPGTGWEEPGQGSRPLTLQPGTGLRWHGQREASLFRRWWSWEAAGPLGGRLVPPRQSTGLRSRSEGAAPAPRTEEWTAAPLGRRSGRQRVRGRHREGNTGVSILPSSLAPAPGYHPLTWGLPCPQASHGCCWEAPRAARPPGLGTRGPQKVQGPVHKRDGQ